MLHVLSFCVAGHTEPEPDWGVVTERDFDAVPPAHVTEHGPQLTQSATLQSIRKVGSEGATEGGAVGTELGAVVGTNEGALVMSYNKYPAEPVPAVEAT